MSKFKIFFKNGDIKEFSSLRGADLRGADLKGVDLYRADLEGADLREANLFKADLFRVDLRRADLRRADLRRANLRGANLNFTKGIMSTTFGQHLAFTFKYDNEVYIKIGCITKPLDHWKEHFERIGKENDYTKNQIHMFKIFMLMVKEFDFNSQD